MLELKTKTDFVKCKLNDNKCLAFVLHLHFEESNSIQKRQGCTITLHCMMSHLGKF